jgi:hypothetical protein
MNLGVREKKGGLDVSGIQPQRMDLGRLGEGKGVRGESLTDEVERNRTREFWGPTDLGLILKSSLCH